MIPGQGSAVGRFGGASGASGKAARGAGRGGVAAGGTTRGKGKGRKITDASLVTEDQWIDEGETTDGVVR